MRLIFIRIKWKLQELIWEFMRPIYKLKRKQYVHFLHIGKTGGTAIKYSLRPHLITDRYVIILRRHNVKLRDIRKGDYVVFFLRDPIGRFVSAFYSRFRQGMPRYFSPWSLDEEAAFQQFTSPNELAVAISAEGENEKARAIKAMQSIEHIRHSYWEWFESEPYFLSRLSDILFVGFQENLSQDFNLLKAKLGLSQNIELPDDIILAHKNPEGLDRTLSQRAVHNLNDWYKKDYEFIRLCKENIKRINQDR